MNSSWVLIFVFSMMSSSVTVQPGFKYEDQCEKVGKATEQLFKSKFPSFWDDGKKNFVCVKLDDSWISGH